MNECGVNGFVQIGTGMNITCVRSCNSFNHCGLRNLSCHLIQSSIKSDYSRIASGNTCYPVDVNWYALLSYAMLKRTPVSFASGTPELLRIELLKPSL